MNSKSVGIFLFVLAATARTIPNFAWAADNDVKRYEDVIRKSYPGFELIPRSGFEAEIQKYTKSNPSLIFGKFSGGLNEDFAALIRSKEKTKEPGKAYYDGKIILCQASGSGKYECRSLMNTALAGPEYLEELYLVKGKPGKKPCLQDGNQNELIAKNDTIGYVYSGKAGGEYVYQSDGSYKECTTGD